MKINYSWQYCLAFMAFVFVFGQLHEMAHLAVAYLICDCNGIQADFNLWTFGASCANNPNTYIATLAGPVFSYALFWAGYFMLRSANQTLWKAAMVLIAGNMAFARIFTAAMGGGDETTVLKAVLHGQPIWFIKLIGLFVVLAFVAPPLYMIYKRLNGKNRIWTMLGICFIPMVIMMLYEFKLLGMVLQWGFLAQPGFLGIAHLIYIHTAIMAVIVIIFRKTLFQAYPKSLT